MCTSLGVYALNLECTFRMSDIGDLNMVVLARGISVKCV